MNKIIFKIRIDHILDLITNSSSELFVIANSMEKATLVEMTNTALTGTGFSIHENDIEERFINDNESVHEHAWKIAQMSQDLGITEDEFKEKMFATGPKWYGISFDRDEIYNSNVGIKLSELGYEMVNGDY